MRRTRSRNWSQSAVPIDAASAEPSGRFRGLTEGDYRGAPPQSLTSTWRNPEAHPLDGVQGPAFRQAAVGAGTLTWVWSSAMKNLLVSALLLAGVLGIALAAHGQSSMGDPFTAGLRQVAAGLTSPVALVEPPDGSRRLFVVDQIGLIRVLQPDGQLLAEPFLDVRDRLVT